MAAVFEGLGDDVAKFIRSKEVLKEIESLMDEQARLGTLSSGECSGP